MKRTFLVVCLLLFPMTVFSEYNSLSSAQEVEYQRQVAIYDEHTRKTIELQDESERQLKKSAAQQEAFAQQLQRAEHQADRMDRLLEIWEKQADRYDALLDGWEKKDMGR